jgi:hypothetical protein
LGEPGHMPDVLVGNLADQPYVNLAAIRAWHAAD